MDLAALLITALLAIMQFAGFSVFGPAGRPDLSSRALSGFSQESVIILISIFILTAALEKSGFARWLTRQILKVSGSSVNRLIFLFSGTAALLSLVMNDVAAGALLIPSVLEASRRTGVNSSKLLIPVSFGSLLGGMATYFATANILASVLLTSASPPQEPLGVLDFFPTGGLIAISGLLFMTFFATRLLPDRKPAAAFRSKRPTGSELERLYEIRERTWIAQVDRKSPLCGQTLRKIGFGENYGLALAAIQNGRRQILLPKPEVEVKAGYRLLIVGNEERVKLLADKGVRIKPEEEKNTLSRRGLAVFELILTPRSEAVGKNLKDLAFRQRYGFSVVAIQRGGSKYRTDVGTRQLTVGDSLLVVGEAARMEALRKERDFILLEPSTADQPVRLKETTISISLLLAAVAAAAAGVPVFATVLAAALIAVFSGA
ncbi:hypothetical protein DRH14_05275, partial [Candidatus Shapirobacteria bacterium]